MLILGTNVAPLSLKAKRLVCFILEHFVLTHSQMDEVIWSPYLYIYRMALQVNLCGLTFLYIPENSCMEHILYYLLSLLVLFQCRLSRQGFRMYRHHWLLCVMLPCPCDTFTVDTICLSIPSVITGLYRHARRVYFSFSPVDAL
jgi:hypothetical protein